MELTERRIAELTDRMWHVLAALAILTARQGPPSTIDVSYQSRCMALDTLQRLQKRGVCERRGKGRATTWHITTVGPDLKWPTHCEHDILYINPEISPDTVSDDDKTKLNGLGFFHGGPDDVGEECFYSFRFGSC